jgi:hypothetical protein
MLQFGFPEESCSDVLSDESWAMSLNSESFTDTALNESTNNQSNSDQDKAVTLMCPACRTQTLRRTERKGFMQRLIYAGFGYYPWKCSTCKSIQLIKNRGRRRRRRNSGS